MPPTTIESHAVIGASLLSSNSSYRLLSGKIVPGARHDALQETDAGDWRRHHEPAGAAHRTAGTAGDW
jgi:hypothetical protein